MDPDTLQVMVRAVAVCAFPSTLVIGLGGSKERFLNYLNKDVCLHLQFTVTIVLSITV